MRLLRSSFRLFFSETIPWNWELVSLLFLSVFSHTPNTHRHTPHAHISFVWLLNGNFPLLIYTFINSMSKPDEIQTNINCQQRQRERESHKEFIIIMELQQRCKPLLVRVLPLFFAYSIFWSPSFYWQFRLDIIQFKQNYMLQTQIIIMREHQMHHSQHLELLLTGIYAKSMHVFISV